MPSSNTKNTTASSACPYAVALHHDEETDNESAADDNATTSKLLASCPAFEKGSCPFKDCQDEDAVRRALLSIPKNHFEENPQFLSVLQELHEIAGNKGEKLPQFRLSCPVASKVQEHVLPHNDAAAAPPVVNFTQAMEGYSLAAIMAKMAEQMELEEENRNASSSNAVEETRKSASADGEKKESMEKTENATAFPAKEEGMKRLSAAFKSGTAVSHQAAEDVHFVRNFIRGKIDRNVYAELVVQLYHVYVTLEDCLLNCTGTPQDENIEQFREFHEKLKRTETLLEDLDFWHGQAKTADVQKNGGGMSAAARDYVERLRYCVSTDPLLLLAHSYTRYLGDLSGGKILARVARRAMGLERGGEGLAFYEFADIASAKKFKDEYRTALDALELTDSQIMKLVAEANVAFLLNMRLFEELDVMANVPGAKVRPLQEALAYADQAAAVAEEKNNNDAECPFMAKNDKKATPKQMSDECPFAKTSTSKDNAASPASKHGRCPWPFIIMHDPVAALQDWQTWAVLGLLLCYAWSKFQG